MLQNVSQVRNYHDGRSYKSLGTYDALPSEELPNKFLQKTTHSAKFRWFLDRFRQLIIFASNMEVILHGPLLTTGGP